MDNVVLVGFMGCGKTTIGKAVAKELKMSFIDTDKEIEKQEGQSIAKIFQSKGEDYFRGLEYKFLKEQKFSNTVLSTGGGMPCFNNNIDLLNNIGVTVFINPSIEELTRRLKSDNENRPLLKSMSNNELQNFVKDKLEERSSYYFKSVYQVESKDELLKLLQSR